MRILFLISIFCISSMAVQAQKNIYKGDFEWQGEFKGTAEYEYIKDRSGKEIPDGKFHFFLVERDSVNQAKLLKKEIKGQYKNGLKEGKWSYMSADHVVIVKDVEEFSAITDLASDMIRIQAEYKSDQPHGTWKYNEEIFRDGKIGLVSVAETMQVKEGYVTGKVHISNKSLDKEQFITGYLDANGHMDSLWTMVYQNNGVFVKEERRYSEGILLSLSQKDDESGEELINVDFSRNNERLKALASNQEVAFKLSEESFGILFNNGYRKNEQKYEAQLAGNEFIEKHILLLFNYDKKYYLKNGQWQKFPVRTKRFEYPIDEEKAKDAKEISKLYKDLSDKVRKNKESSALNINKNRTDSLAFAFAFFQAMDEKVKQLKEIIDLYETGEIKYVDEEVFFQEGLSFLSSFDTIKYTFDEKEREKIIEERKIIETKEQLSRFLLAYLENEYHLVDKIADYVKSVLEKLEIDSSISDLDEKILTLKDIVDDLYSGTNYFSDKHEKLIRRIERVFLTDLFERKQNEYAKTDTYGKKVEKAEEVIDLLNELDKRHEEFYKIFERRDDIDELYYENVFNAFTFSSYDQRAKERLYKSGNEKLFSYYFEQMMAENEFSAIINHLEKIRKLQDRLVELRDQETRKIERKLRRTSKPAQIASILGLD